MCFDVYNSFCFVQPNASLSSLEPGKQGKTTTETAQISCKRAIILVLNLFQMIENFLISE